MSIELTKLTKRDKNGAKISLVLVFDTTRLTEQQSLGSKMA